jgi:hypothetical protein
METVFFLFFFTPRAPLILPEARERRRLLPPSKAPPSPFPHRRHRQELPGEALVAPAAAGCLPPRAWRRFRGLLFRRRCCSAGGGLARRIGSRGRVGIDAAARSLAAGQRGGAGGRRRPFGPDLGPFGPHLGLAGLAGLCATTRLPGVEEVRRRY